MFKIGDYVKCINNFDCYGLELGKIYKIEDVHPDYYEILITLSENERSYYMPSRFIKINRKEKLERILNER